MMTAFLSAWSVLKNAPVPDYAQPKTESSRTALGDRREENRYNQREMGKGVHPLQHIMAGTPYGTAVRMPRPEVGSGESSFDSERVNTGSSVFNPTPSWQNVGQGPVGEMYANRLNNMAGEMGATSPAIPTPPPTPPQPTPPSAAMGATGSPTGVQQQPNDGTGRYPQQQTLGRYS